MFALSTGFSQSLVLFYEGTDVSNDTLTFEESNNEGIIVGAVDITNNNANRLGIKVRKTEISLIEGSVNTFCWGGNCFPPFTYESPTAFQMDPGTTNSDFVGDYDHNDFYGESMIAYTFFDELDPTDSVRIVMKFNNIDPIGVVNNFDDTKSSI